MTRNGVNVWTLSAVTTTAVWLGGCAATGPVSDDGAPSTVATAPDATWHNPTVPASGCGLSVIRWFVDDSLRAALQSERAVEFVSEEDLLAQLMEDPSADGDAETDSAEEDAENETDAAAPYQVAIENEIFRPDVADVVRAHAEWRPDDAQRFATLRRNGFAVARIPIDRMGSLITELGSVRRAVRSWQGQAPDWRDLATQSNEGRTRGVAIDGRVQRIEGGTFKLQFRSWLMPMEDGPQMQFELRSARAERLAPQAFRQNITERITPFDGAHAEALLEPGYVYVLAAIRSGEVWFPEQVASADAVTGPRAAMPMMLGPLLLDGAERGIVRELILIEPVVPAALHPPASAADQSPQAEGVGA